MNAFISWSGTRELLIAKAIKKWLTAVVPETQPFISPDLDKGQPWFDALAKKLQDAEIGFMCLAPPRVASDWQLVEAGAIWKAARRGGLFPICFGISKTDVPEPLRVFQLTRFDKEDFRRLATDVTTLARPEHGWTPEREQIFELSWSRLKTDVEVALSQPDDGVHTTRGFIHEIAGGWWERVRSEHDDTQLSWMWFEPSSDGTSQTITGRGFSEGGSHSSRWETDLVSFHAQLPEPTLEYYWEGRHLPKSKLLFGGKGWFRFVISENGGINQGAGEFKDVCMEEAQPPTTKLVDLQRATQEEISIMKGNDENKRRVLADQKLKDWP